MTTTDNRLIGEADASAQAAATRAGVEVKVLTENSDMSAAERLLSEIWGVESDSVVPAHVMKAVSHSGNYLSGAFLDRELVGTSLAFRGWHVGHLYLHSHITGVSAAMQGRDVGFALKQHQRAWALSNGLDHIVWTFDPLVARNGYFNIAKLGAEIIGYETDFYGQMRDSLNADDESDRCVVRWVASSPRVLEAAAGRLQEPFVDEQRVTRVLVVGAEGEPHMNLVQGDILLAEIPKDIVKVRRENAEVAAAWRRALREVLLWAFSEGFGVTDMTKAGAYVLSQEGRL